MRPVLLSGALLVALAGLASHADDACDRAPSAVVVRAGVPLAIGEGGGDGSFHAGCWRVAGAWSADARHVRVAVAIARTCS